MKKLIALALVASAALTIPATAQARDGCGRGGHRGPAGHCRYNRGPGYVAVAPGLVIGRFYNGRGYWDGRRYYQQRYRHHGGWRYR